VTNRSTAPRYIPHYTLADYQQWKGDWELWQGIPVAIPRHFALHQFCASKIMSSLFTSIQAEKCAAVVVPAIDWIISSDTVVRPDILVLCGDVPEEHVTRPPALFVEILCPSTAQRDQNEKKGLYEQNSVKYYLIADPKEKTIQAYRRNEQGDFESFDPAGEQEFAVCDDCRIRWDVKSSF
jgi:Uma2 family endonuclease